ncbi:MAG: hypothetical protein U0Z53_22030 [Blastocatellia bacterium]
MNARKIFSATLLQTLIAALFLTLPLLAGNVQAQTQVAVVATVTTGGQPTGLGIDPSSNLIYVANKSGNSVAVIDGSTDTVLVSAIPVGSNPVAIAVSRSPRRIFVANTGDATLSVIDSDTASPTFNTVINTISLTSAVPLTGLNNVRGICVFPDPTNGAPKVYVPATTGTAGKLLIVDPATNGITTVSLPSGGNNPVTAVAQLTGSLRVIVGYADRARLSYVSPLLPIPVNGANVGDQQQAVGVNQWFNKIFVHRRTGGANSVWEVKTVDGTGVGTTVVANGTTTVTKGFGDIGVAYGRNYVANGTDNTVSVIDTYCSAPDPNGGSEPSAPCPVPNPNPNPNQYLIIQTVTVGTTPWGVAVNGSSGKIYVANSGSGTVSVLAKQQN